MHRSFLVPITVLTLILLMVGCSGNTSSPASPDLTSDSRQAVTSSSQQLWGFWNITLDKETGEFTTVPLRQAMFQANVTQFLQPPIAPVHLLQIAIVPGETDMANGYVVCEVNVRHPFPGLAVYRGFDVKGILISDGSIIGADDTTELWPGPDKSMLLNADGYTRWWNPSEFTTYETILGFTKGKLAPMYLGSATINGYKYFSDALDPEDTLDPLTYTNRGTLSTVPGENSRRYEIQFEMVDEEPFFGFNYAVTASYLDPVSHEDPGYPLDAFPASANSPEPFRIAVSDNGSTAYYENDSSFGGNLNLNIEVYDWGFNFTSTVTDEIAAISIESPTLFAGSVPVDLGSVDPGTTPLSWIIPVTVPDVTPTGVDNQEILIRVESTHEIGYAPDIPGITGFDYPEDVPLAAYDRWEVPIGNLTPENTPPTIGVIDGPSVVMEGDTEVYTLSFANDPEDGTNLTILWENDGDDDFDDDLDGDDTDLSADLNFPTQGNYTLYARAVDSGGLYTDSEPFEVEVPYCPDAIHDSFSNCYLTGVSGSNFWRMDSGRQTTGTYEDDLILQIDYTRLGHLDTSSGSSWPVQDYISLQNSGSGTIVFSIDVCDYSGRVIVAGRFTSGNASTFYVYDKDGTYLSSFDVGGGRRIGAIDTFENGDIWVATCQYNGYSAPDNTYLQHYEYQDASPYYIEDTSDMFDTTSQVNNHSNIWDIAISFAQDRLYLFHGNYGNSAAPYGEIYSYDIASDGTLTNNTSVQNLSVFPYQVTGAYMDGQSNCTYGKIDIDHGSEASDNCRIIAMARSYPAGGTILGLLDQDLDLVDYSVIHGTPYSFSIGLNDVPADRQIVATAYNSGYVYKSEAPAGW